MRVLSYACVAIEEWGLEDIHNKCESTCVYLPRLVERSNWPSPSLSLHPYGNIYPLTNP